MAAEFIKAVSTQSFEYVDIRQFQNQPGIGFACNCSCPECGKKVGARIFINRPGSSCFFHEADEYNKNCNGGAGETELHLLAKRLLEQEREIFLPHPEDESKAVKFVYAGVALEKKVSLLRPDLMLIAANGQKLLVEITVTHKTINNPLKVSRLTELGIPAIEISLDRSLISRIILRHSEALSLVIFTQLYRKAVIEDTTRKIWLVKPDSLFKLDSVEGEEKENVMQAKKEDNSIWIFIALIIVIYFIVRSLLKRQRTAPSNRRKRR